MPLRHVPHEREAILIDRAKHRIRQPTRHHAFVSLLIGVMNLCAIAGISGAILMQTMDNRGINAIITFISKPKGDQQHQPKQLHADVQCPLPRRLRVQIHANRRIKRLRERLIADDRVVLDADAGAAGDVRQ